MFVLQIRAVKAQTSLHIHTMLPEPFSLQIHKLQVLTDIAFTAQIHKLLTDITFTKDKPKALKRDYLQY